MVDSQYFGPHQLCRVRIPFLQVGHFIDLFFLRKSECFLVQKQLTHPQIDCFELKFDEWDLIVKLTDSQAKSFTLWIQSNSHYITVSICLNCFC